MYVSAVPPIKMKESTVITAALIAAAIIAVCGLVLKKYLPQLTKSAGGITWNEYIAGVILGSLVLVPSVFAIGRAWSVSDAASYQEFYNGVETSATIEPTNCEPGRSGNDASAGRSNCRHQRNSGISYTYLEPYIVTDTTCDSQGSCTTTSRTEYRPATAYIYYPYTTTEYEYIITDSIGGTYAFPGSYVKDEESFDGTPIPESIPRADPQEWVDSRQNLDAGTPRPVTRLFNYDNYILAAQEEMLLPFSEDIDRYLEQDILPDHTDNIVKNPLYGFSSSYADKVRLVGVEVNDEEVWQQTLMSFNAALGTELQGDLHLVLIDSTLVDSPTGYANALKAHWLSDDFGRRAIAKNAIIVVAGVQDDTIVWAQATTGMPFGNEVMLRGIVNFLPDTPLSPSEVIGAPSTVVSVDGEVSTVTLSSEPGVLEQVVLQDFPFQRACMECLDEDGQQIGYKDLIAKVQPQPWQWTVMVIVIVALSSVYWFFASKYELFNWVPGVKPRKHD